MSGINFDFGALDSLFSGKSLDFGSIDGTDFEADIVEDISTDFENALDEDGFYSRDDFDDTIHDSLSENDSYTSLSKSEQAKVRTELADQLWTQAGAEDIELSSGMDIQEQEYEERISALRDELGDSESVKLEDISNDDGLRDKVDELGIADSDGVITEEAIDELEAKLENADGFGGEEELAILDVNGDKEIDAKDGDFSTKEDGDAKVINEKDKAVGSIEESEESSDSSDSAEETFEKLMKALKIVAETIESTQTNNAANQTQGNYTPVDNTTQANLQVSQGIERAYARIAETRQRGSAILNA